MLTRTRVATMCGVACVVAFAVARLAHGGQDAPVRNESVGAIAPATASPTEQPNALAQEAVDRLVQTGAVKSGTPEVVFVRQVSPADMAELGFGDWAHEEGCDIPLTVVIIKGDFDLSNMYGVAEGPVPAIYYARIYDTRIGAELASYGAEDGSMVKGALNDPSLPDPSSAPNGYGYPIPCDPTPIEAPGATDEEVSALETQEA